MIVNASIVVAVQEESGLAPIHLIADLLLIEVRAIIKCHRDLSLIIAVVDVVKV
jgi:hypothetical protein